jgi:hypothetical protein
MIGLSVPRVITILNLLKLDEEIRSFILSLDSTDERLKVVTERRLRPLVQVRNPDEQKRQFVEMTGVDLIV